MGVVVRFLSGQSGFCKHILHFPSGFAGRGATALLGVHLSGSSSGPAIPRASKGVCQALIGGFGLPSPV